LLVKNTGTVNSDEVVQTYIKYPQADRMPLKELKAFKRIHVPSGKEKKVMLSIPVSELKKWDLKKHAWEIAKGNYQVFVGSHSQDERLIYDFRVR
jgi:beta-glucosidase